MGNRNAFNTGVLDTVVSNSASKSTTYDFSGGNWQMYIKESNSDFPFVLPAFRKLGLDCANWPEPVYLDLLRCEIQLVFVIIIWVILISCFCMLELFDT